MIEELYSPVTSEELLYLSLDYILPFLLIFLILFYFSKIVLNKMEFLKNEINFKRFISGFISLIISLFSLSFPINNNLTLEDYFGPQTLLDYLYFFISKFFPGFGHMDSLLIIILLLTLIFKKDEQKIIPNFKDKSKSNYFYILILISLFLRLIYLGFIGRLI